MASRKPAATDPSAGSSNAPLALPPVPDWLQGPLQTLLERRTTLHHALLIHGPPGIGKLAFAQQLAAAMLCEQSPRSAANACGQCQACHWFTERTHPDFRAVLPEAIDPLYEPTKVRKPSQEIRVDQIRDLSRFMAVGAHRAGWRVVLIHPAEAMNNVTANSLLKTLEEPGQNTVILLVTSRPGRLTATVRSRCRSVPLRAPDQTSALTWLLAHGAPDPATAQTALAAAGSPLHALELVEPVQATAHQAILETIASLPDTPELRAVDALDSYEPQRWANVLRRWISDMTRVSAGASPLYFPARLDRLQGLSVRTNLDRLTRLQGELGLLNARIEHPLNARLICESTLLAYCQLFDQTARER